MSKRKLNRRQQWRIEKIQAEKAARADKKASKVESDLTTGELSPEQKGRVVAHFGQTVEIEPLSDDDSTIIPDPELRQRCFVRANIDSLVTGDIVVWRAGVDDKGVVEARLERQSVLQRPDNYGQLKPVAANIDRIVIVVATEPVPHVNLIDRYLVASETLDIQPTILFNKSDLIDDSNRQDIERMIALYRSLGYEVLSTSANDIEDCETHLLNWLSDHTSVFVGQSGVGKSSLIRSILGDQTIRVGPLSETTRKGTHTTTTARLFHLPKGGKLVDSPGIREFGLWHIDEHELLEGFIEFHPFLGHCKFRDCQHKKEPGCAILEAHENGDITDGRMQSYERIKATLGDIETFNA